MNPTRAFPFGAQYYRPPNPPRQDWKRDLFRMKEHGFNTVKLWACWSWMNPRPADYVFDDLDELMTLAEDAELAVVINVILENCPYWLAKAHPEGRYLAHDGLRVDLTAAINTPAGGWPGLCFDNEPVWRAGAEFLTAVVARYRTHPALATWDVWNEPHMEPSWYHPERLFCYCEASIERFRSWLAGRYGDLEMLNQGWTRRYSAWAEVEPPRVFETYPDFLDWRLFWLENLALWLQARVELARQLDAEHAVMTHIASSGYQGTMAINTWDEWLLADKVERFGTSSFPLWLMGNDPAIHAFHLVATRDAARGKRFWQSELQGGRGRREGRKSTPHPDPNSIRLWIWNALAAGAKGVLFWQWRPELLGPESPGYGLCTTSGEPTERALAAKEMANVVADFPELLVSTPVSPSIGLVVSRQTALLTYAGDRTMELYASALRGTFRAFWDNDVPVCLVHEDELMYGRLPDGLEALYWPMPMAGTQALAAALAAFVERGGTLIAEAAPLQHIEHGWASAKVPGHGLDQLFGVEEVESDASGLVRIDLDSGDTIQGEGLVERLRPSAGGRVVGRFSDGSPAVVENRHGLGRTLLVATYTSLAYETSRDRWTGSWIARSAHGATGPVFQEPVIEGLQTCLHATADGMLVFAVNWSHRPVKTRLKLPQSGVFTRASTGISQLDDALGVDLGPRSGAVAVVEFPQAKEKVR